MDTQTDRQRASLWARRMLATPGARILDTETTGLGYDDQIVSIAIMTTAGQVLLDTLVKPTIAIPDRATAIHGITDAMVQNSPSFADCMPQLRDLLSGETVLIYNADFDIRMMEQSAAAHDLPCDVPIFAGEYRDVMDEYAAFYGDWNQRHGSYTWQPLRGGDHSALGDCRACLALLQRMASAET